jgi:hypothetical protein
MVAMNAAAAAVGKGMAAAADPENDGNRRESRRRTWRI